MGKITAYTIIKISGRNLSKLTIGQASHSNIDFESIFISEIKYGC